MKNNCLTFCLLITSIVGYCQVSSFNFGTVVLSNQEFKNDTIINAQKIIFKTGGKIRVRNGANVTFIAQILEVENPNFIIDGRGEAGENGASKPDWASTKSHGVNGPIGGSTDGHKQWTEAGGHPNDIGNNGLNGGNGATILIQYKIFQGTNGSVNNINYITDGGKGGAGGIGKKLICGDDPSHFKYGPTGKNGIDGIKGNFRVELIQ
jgi:hypothetical protein